MMALASLTGCHLVDQRTFDAKAGLKPAAPVIATTAKPGPPPLITIRYDTPDPPYREALDAAVRRARARRPDVIFTVETLVPAAGSAEDQAAIEEAASATGEEVAQAILAAGADPAEVELAVRADPGVTVKEVRVSLH